MPADLQAETTELLRRLIQFDTVNPPGNERACQEYLAAHLTAAGFEVELLGAEEERPNLVARLRGEEPGPVLGLLGHVDTVLAHPEEWEHDPWSGAIADGFLWGRGALDMKSQVAAEVAAATALAREGWRPKKGDLLVMCVVDEETGGALGAQWLTREHPDKVRCDYLLNEGGGEQFEYRGRRRYGVCVAEKGVFRFTLVTEGVAGHASQPKMGDNALLKLAPLLERLATRQPSYELTEAPAAFLRGLGEDPAQPEAALARMAQADPRLIPLFEPMFGVTLTPTRVSASEKINVIPSRAELKIDCRVPPGLGQEAVERAIAEVLGPQLGSRLREAINGWIGSQDPAGATVPLILPGFTDSRHFRAAFPDCVAYGFFPQLHQSRFDTAPLVHSANERIDLRDLGFAATFYRDVIVELLR
jgi:acetylornithine deacetylase/succinyl-diaminopimelate desuccinylase-like protein